MKLECIKDKLVNAISKAEKITGKNLTLPVLSCLMLEAKDNSLKVIATNLDLGIEIIVPVSVVEEGKITVLGNILNGLISGDSRSNKVTLETKDDNLTVLTENSSTVIKSQASDDFPTIPRLNDEKPFVIDAKKLMKGLKSVWYSSSTSNIKPELSSVLVYVEGKSLIFAATDSFRLAEIKIDTEGVGDFDQILIPFKNIPEILRVFDDIDGGIKIYLTKNQIAFEYDNIYLTSRIVDGVFPDYQQLIPKEFTTEVTVLKDDLMNSLKVSNIFSDKFNKITFKIDPSKKIFQTISKNNDVGENTNKVDSVLSGDEVEISFNQKYIMDCFQSINADSLTLRFNGLNKPMVIKSVPDTQFTYLVMPMNK
ncbi:DNA polymerase III subunit beta [Patescibacteria group bacterium]|nr:DNA polymerase III subunit beta [Patescibacteria group bacterium]